MSRRKILSPGREEDEGGGGEEGVGAVGVAVGREGDQISPKLTLIG